MKKSKATRIVLIICMIISIIGIFILESAGCSGLRKEVSNIFVFLSGKRTLFSNIFLGILASAFCMFVGECVSICIMRKTAKKEITELAYELWPVIYVKPGKGRESYIQSAYIFIEYQSEIKRLYREYDRKNDETGLVINLLNQLLTTYKCICENHTMKNNNYQFFKELMEGLKIKIEDIYEYSQYDDDIMSIRMDIEKLINEFNEYKGNMEAGIDKCIEIIVEIEKELERTKNIREKENL